MTVWTNYLDFLTWLSGLGEKLPQIVAYIQAIVVACEGLVTLLAPSPKKLMSAAAPPSAEEMALEHTIALSLSSSGVLPHKKEFGAATGTTEKAAWDGTILRQLWAFIQAHPEIITFLLTLLKR